MRSRDCSFSVISTSQTVSMVDNITMVAVFKGRKVPQHNYNVKEYSAKGKECTRHHSIKERQNKCQILV